MVVLRQEGLSEHEQEMPALLLLLTAGCHLPHCHGEFGAAGNNLGPGEPGAVSSLVQTSASSFPTLCFLHRCLLLQLEESSKGNQSQYKLLEGREFGLRSW